MMREPLMLSDTAMVLIRRLVELESDNQAFREYERRPHRSYLKGRLWPVPPESGEQALQVQTELFYELQCLWTGQELGLFRHLDWHISFDESLMTAADKLYRPERDETTAQAWIFILERLMILYEEHPNTSFNNRMAE